MGRLQSDNVRGRLVAKALSFFFFFQFSFFVVGALGYSWGRNVPLPWFIVSSGGFVPGQFKIILGSVVACFSLLPW